MIYDFLIVGAGITGLNTARLLLEKYPEKKICLTDKSKRIGGLICTENKKPENKKLSVTITLSFFVYLYLISLNINALEEFNKIDFYLLIFKAITF